MIISRQLNKAIKIYTLYGFSALGEFIQLVVKERTGGRKNDFLYKAMCKRVMLDVSSQGAPNKIKSLRKEKTR